MTIKGIDFKRGQLVTDLVQEDGTVWRHPPEICYPDKGDFFLACWIANAFIHAEKERGNKQ